MDSDICIQLKKHFKEEYFWVIIDGVKRELLINGQKVGITWELGEYPPKNEYDAVLVSFLDQLIPNIVNYLAVTKNNN